MPEFILPIITTASCVVGAAVFIWHHIRTEKREADMHQAQLNDILDQQRVRREQLSAAKANAERLVRDHSKAAQAHSDWRRL